MKQEPGVEHVDSKDSKAPAHSARTCYPPTVPASSSAPQSASASSPPAYPRVCNDLTLPDPNQTQTTNTTTPSQSNYHIHQSTHPLELHLRALLSPPPDPSKTHTLTTGARQCPAHHAIQNHLEDREKRQPYITYYTATPAYDTTFLVTRSTLQPLCGSCIEEETGFDQLLLPPGLDLCRCATILASAECVNCAIERVNEGCVVRKKGEGKEERCGRCGEGEVGGVKWCGFCKGVVVV